MMHINIEGRKWDF